MRGVEEEKSSVMFEVVLSSVEPFKLMMGKMLVLGLFCQAEDGIRDLVRSRGLGDVYKRQRLCDAPPRSPARRIGLSLSD